MQISGLPTRMPTPFADSGVKNTIPIASQISVTPGRASFTDGFPPLTRTPVVAGGVPPYGTDFNGILNAITTALRWNNAGGQYAYDSTFSAAVGGYPKGALLARSGYDGFWLSTTDNNATNPDTGGAGWVNPITSGVVGSCRNVRMAIASQSATASLTADEIVVESALGGVSYKLASFNKTVNLATTGAGGMDVGTATAASFVAIYAIFNPTTNVSALLATMATTKVAEVYGGANMPGGYTASALLVVVPTGAAGTMAVCTARDREVHISSAYVYTTSSIVTGQLVTATTAPLNAVSISGTIEAGCTAASQVGTLVSDGDVPGVGLQTVIGYVLAGGNAVASFCGVKLTTARQFAVSTSLTGSGTGTYKVATSGYTI